MFAAGFPAFWQVTLLPAFSVAPLLLSTYFLALRSSFMTKIVASETATDSAIVFMGAPF